MAQRFNINSASREELQNAVRHLHSKVNDLQTQLKSNQQQQSNNSSNNTGGGGVASTIANFFTSPQANRGGNNNSEASTTNQQKGSKHVDPSFLSPEAKSRIESLEVELETERRRHHEDIEIMQQQVDQLTIRAADDAEAIEKLRKAADEMKALARQHEQEIQQQQQQSNAMNSIFGEDSAPKNVVDNVASSFAKSMAGLADERDVAKLEQQKLTDENKTLKVALLEEKKKNKRLEAQLEELSERLGRSMQQNESADQKVERGKEISRKKYDRLYERFMLLKKRFEGELESGVLIDSNNNDKRLVMRKAPSSSESDSESEALQNQKQTPLSVVASKKAVVGTSVSGGPVTPKGAISTTSNNAATGVKKAVVFHAAQLHDDHDDDDDEERIQAQIRARAAQQQQQQSNTPSDLSPSVDEERSTPASAPNNTSKDSINAGLAIAKAFQQQKDKSSLSVSTTGTQTEKEENSHPSALLSASSPQVVSTREVCEQEVQCELLSSATAVKENVTTVVVDVEGQTPQQQKVQSSVSRSINKEASDGAVGVSSSPAPTAVTTNERGPSSVSRSSSLSGSITFDHDLSVLSSWDGEDIRTLRRLLNF